MFHWISTILRFLQYFNCWHGVCLRVQHWPTHLQFSCQLVQLPMLAWILPMQNSCQLQPPPELAWMLQHKQNSCQLWALLVSDQSWHECCYMQKLCQCWPGGPCWLVLIIVVATHVQKRWKLGIIPCVLTTVSHWLDSWLPQLLQQWKNSLTFV